MPALKINQQQDAKRSQPSIPSLTFLSPLSLSTSFATSLFSKYLKNLNKAVLYRAEREKENNKHQFGYWNSDIKKHK